jgi:tetratricopeptide (TPR) repeat protein
MFIFADFIYNLYRNLKFGYSSDSEGYKESAFSYLQSGQTKKALKDISIAIKLSKNEILDSDRAQLFYERSKIRRSIGDKNGALTDLSWAIYINPRDIEMYKERLILREEIGDIKGAEQDSATIKSMREVIMNYRELPNLSFLEKERPIREPQKGISTTKAALGGAFAGTIYGIIKSHKKWKDKEEKKKGKKSK